MDGDLEFHRNFDKRIQGFGSGFSVSGGTAIHDFEEYTFRAPRPGCFLGDTSMPSGDVNPVVCFEWENSRQRIPPCPLARPFLGKLDVLPTELLCEIFVYLDIYSLLTFRRVNQHANNVVDNSPGFRSLILFPKLLGAVEALQCCSWTVKALIRCVHDDRCSACGHFGDFMYLVTPERWCYRCWLGNKQLVVQPITDSMMSQEEMDQARQHIPHVRLSPGYYGLNGEMPVNKPIILFDLRAIQHALPAASSWPNVRRTHALHYTTIIRAPYWDTQSTRFEEGFFCRACASQGWTHRTREYLTLYYHKKYPVWGLPWRRYTRAGIKAHIECYGTIFKIQKSDGPKSDGGIRYVHEKPFEEYTWQEPDELRDIHSTLCRCRNKEIELPQGQQFLRSFTHVSNAREMKEEITG